MTKKSLNLLNKYIEINRTSLILFDDNFYTFQELQKITSDEEKKFQEMLCGMLHYDLINENDFQYLYEKASNVRFDIIDEALEKI